jgi:uncharacterized Zn-finger protein
LTTITTIKPEVTEDEYAGHPFNKIRAAEFTKQSPLDSWLQGIILCKIEDEETYDHPRVLMQLLGDYLEISLKAAKNRDDYEKICALCKMGFQMKQELFLKDEIMLCGEDCEYAKYNFGIKE